jgi:hypothetical protein
VIKRLRNEAIDTRRSGTLSMVSDICERNRFFAGVAPRPARENGRSQGTTHIVLSSLQTANRSGSDFSIQNNVMRFGAGALKAKSSALSPSQYLCHLQTSTALSTAIRIVSGAAMAGLAPKLNNSACNARCHKVIATKILIKLPSIRTTNPWNQRRYFREGDHWRSQQSRAGILHQLQSSDCP